jgi:myo-inositol catabolism protein IolC
LEYINDIIKRIEDSDKLNETQTNEQLKDEMDVLQNLINELNISMGQGKDIINETYGNLTNRIEDFKNYILESNQKIREILSNEIGQIRLDSRSGRRAILEENKWWSENLIDLK